MPLFRKPRLGFRNFPIIAEALILGKWGSYFNSGLGLAATEGLSSHLRAYGADAGQNGHRFRLNEVWSNADFAAEPAPWVSCAFGSSGVSSSSLYTVNKLRRGSTVDVKGKPVVTR
jgi:hypothetical protein